MLVFGAMVTDSKHDTALWLSACLLQTYTRNRTLLQLTQEGDGVKGCIRLQDFVSYVEHNAGAVAVRHNPTPTASPHALLRV